MIILQKFSIKDIAEAANVSIATVSRVFSEKDKVSPETKNKVLKVAKEFGYQPNGLWNFSHALSDDSKLNLQQIIVLIPSIANFAYNGFIQGIQNEANTNGFGVLLCQSMSDVENIKRYISLLKSDVASGLISLDYEANTDSFFGLNNNYPIVQCGEYNEALHFPYISVNDRAAAENAVQYLISTGHRKIALATVDLDFKFARERQTGYENKLRENGMNVDQSLILKFERNMDFNVLISAAESFLKLPNRPDAIFAISDMAAAAFIKAAKRINLNVPNDLAVIGFDNSEICMLCDPAISSVSQPRYKMGKAAAKIVIDLINGKNIANHKIIFETELIIREST